MPGIIGTANDDTLIGSNGADSIEGAQGNDRLLGEYDDDTLIGGTGNDTMTGGAGSDLLRFETASGYDVVMDFQGGASGDLIDLVGTGIHTFAQAQAAMTQQGADVVLDLGGGSQVQFLNTLLADFDASRFSYG